MFSVALDGFWFFETVILRVPESLTFLHWGVRLDLFRRGSIITMSPNMWCMSYVLMSSFLAEG